MMKYEIFKDVVENAVLDYLPPEFQMLLIASPASFAAREKSKWHGL